MTACFTCHNNRRKNLKKSKLKIIIVIIIVIKGPCIITLKYCKVKLRPSSLKDIKPTCYKS